MENAQPFEADRRVDLVEERVECDRVGDVDARHVEMARVEAEAEPRMTVEPLVERRELVERAADGAAGAGGVLHQQPGLVRAQLQQQPHCGQDALDAGLETDAQVGADVENDPVSTDRTRDLHRVVQRRDRFLVHVVLRRGEVAEVQSVAEDAVETDLGAAFPEACEVCGVVIRRPPRSRALREDLQRFGADALGTVDRRLNAAGRRKMCPDVHQRSQAPSSDASSSTALRAARGSGANGSSATFPRLS